MLKKKNGNERNMNKTKLVTGEDGKVHQVKCKVCSKIEVKDKLLTFNLNSLWKHKHSGRKKTLVAILGIYKVGKFYMKKYSIHAKNEHLYANVKKDTIAN
jgi:ribosomal protein S26